MWPTGIVSGGLAGMVILVERLGGLNGLNIPVQVIMIMLNIPVVVPCCKEINSRSTIFSLV